MEAIYGSSAGQDFCEKGPRATINCFLSAYCHIFDRINGLSVSQKPEVNNSLIGGNDPCRGYIKYLKVKYRCGQWSAPASGK